jgi:hypothetical protein
MTDNAEHLSITLPEQKNYDVAYGLAFKLASEKLASLEDLETQCSKSDSVCRTDGTAQSIILNYLNSSYRVDFPDINISYADNNGQVELRDKILILHYLTWATGVPLSGQLIAYQELKEGAIYLPTFIKRAVKPLIDYFGQSPELLMKASIEMGGIKTNLGDIAVTIPAFSRVPINCVIWRGDEEFSPNPNILFDSTIMDYLPVEDINVLCQTIAWRLVKNLSSFLKPN